MSRSSREAAWASPRRETSVSSVFSSANPPRTAKKGRGFAGTPMVILRSATRAPATTTRIQRILAMTRLSRKNSGARDERKSPGMDAKVIGMALADASGPEATNLCPAQPGHARQDLIRVLAQERWGRADASGRRLEADGHAEYPHALGLGMRQGHDHAALQEVRALADLRHALDSPRRDPGLIESREPLLGPAGGEDPVQKRDQRLPRLDALRLAVEATVPRQVRPVQRLAQSLPEGVVGDAHGQVDVGGLEDLIGHDGRVLVAPAGGALAGGEVDPGLIRQERRHDVQHGHLHLLALPRPLAGVEGQHDPVARSEEHTSELQSR